MAVNYNVVARKNPQKREEAPKFYVSLNSRGRRNLRYLAHRIADKSSLNEIDVKAVIEGFIQVIFGNLTLSGYFFNSSIVASNSFILTLPEFFGSTKYRTITSIHVL